MAVAVCANDHHPAVACTAPQLKSTLLVYKGAVVTLRNVTFAANKPSGVRPPHPCRTRAPAAHTYLWPCCAAAERRAAC